MIKKVNMILAIAMCCITVSCKEKKQHNDSSAEKALQEGYVFVDGTHKIIHWDKNCKRAIQKVMLLKPIKEVKRDVEYCSCVPVSKLKEINEFVK